MTNKKNKRASRKVSDVTNVKPHHAKPYRKRHFGLLVLALVSSTLLLILLISHKIAKLNAEESAKELAASLSQSEAKSISKSTISSTHGFYLDYDSEKLYASAIESRTNKLFVSSELNNQRAYSTIKLSEAISTKPSSVEPGSITFQYYPDSAIKTASELTKLENSSVGSINKNYLRQSSNPTKLDGVEFQATTWRAEANDGLGSSLSVELTTYAGIVNNSPMIITLSNDLVGNPSAASAISEALSSLKFGTPPKKEQVSSSQTLKSEQNNSLALSLLDRLTFTRSTNAVSNLNPPSSSEKISTLYGPAVVKIYNLYCMDIVKDGLPFVQNACKGSTGSGFMISGDGYIATNGHVAVNSPLDIAIENALKQYSEGDTLLFNDLVKESGLSEFDLLGAKNDKEKAAIILDKFYTIPKDRFKAENNVENILVGLSEDQPDINELVTLTQNRQKYSERDTIKQAKLIADDYRAFDGAVTGKFKSSDVAIIKIDGSSFPSVKLGNINSLTQGSGLNIIGFPGAAGTNELVESSQSRATLTSGKVSSIKSASGSSNQLIETDATIGHGNSGGPAFNDSGEVVGIATYTVDGSGEGDGVFNYVRDIADLSSLATKNSVNLSQISETQKEWEEGVNFFYQARYSKAVKNFERVKSLYPQHAKVAQFTSLAEQKIAAGEELKDFPMTLVIGALLTTLSVTVLAVFLIIRHKKNHQVYLQQNISPTSEIYPQTSTTIVPAEQNPPQYTQD